MNWSKNYEIEILLIDDTKLAKAVNEQNMNLVDSSAVQNHLNKNGTNIIVIVKKN